MDSNQKKDISNLLIVMTSAIGCAVLALGYMMYTSQSENQYLLNHILISPDVIQTLNYPLAENRNKKAPALSFKRIEYSYFDSEKHQWITKEISSAKYADLYAYIASDKSIETPSDDMIDAFLHPQPIKLTLFVEERSSNQASPLKSVFQEVDFSAKGDFFRVQLREQTLNSQQAYFYHPHIYAIVQKILNESP
ncbi:MULTISPECIES: hypothetical protein [Parachlamydia]|uniref:hypothetical protein n=1 Tax=Parachlamydia TaxID=83551 RepID=UPI0001C17B74|nr:hypothetical protein [Parachlamydia acanthamoebae]EFB42460.1 hypothetical protein pah_c008o084 [Parachlamydia acanthamoebae str. Hall's coccus]